MEVVPPSYIARNHTPSSISSGRHPASAFMSTPQQHPNNAHFSSYSQPSSLRSSDSTQTNSNLNLFTAPPLPTATPSSQLNPNDSVLNRRGDESSSLFQICVMLRLRLSAFPGFEAALQEEEMEAGEDADPVTILWRFFRRGYPLMDLYNALNPRVPLEVDPNKVNEKKRGQAATFKFMHACMKELNITDSFMVTDLYGDDTTGFVKVTRVVNQVLDILVREGVLGPEATVGQDVGGPAVKKTKRQHIVDELVQTERTYVQHLEMLQAFKKAVEEKGVIGGDAIHDIFHNLNSLLDFQRRFLIRVEQTNLLREEDQNWGSLFTLYRDAFMVYEPYISNQKKCEETAMREFEKLKEIDGPPELRQFVENPTVLSAFLLKPFQRLSKYPLLLKELRDKGDYDPERIKDINEGIEAAAHVLVMSNTAIDRQERTDAISELGERVEDWKGHKLENFGDLLLFGTFQVIKGDSGNPKDQEREYKIYLFEMILLCCKEVNANKQKNKITGKQLVDKRGRPRLQLKGRIFMQNVTDIVSSTKPGSYTCQIFWKGDPGIEYFTIKFTSEEILRKWADHIQGQQVAWKAQLRSSAQRSVPDDEFQHMRDMQLENPFLQNRPEDDDDDVDGSTLASFPSHSGFTMGRNDSNPSLRSRSGTMESIGPGMYRMPPRQFPMGSQAPSLQVRTGAMAMSPPQDFIDSSFFSPATESPISTRSSGTPSMYSYHNRSLIGSQHGPPPVIWDDHRYTAPAMPRQQLHSYQPAARIPTQRPSLPPSAHSSSAVQSRLRSASSPDIANPLHRRYDPAQVPPMPDLPNFPAAYAYPPNLLNRSQSSSPAQAMTNLPVRTTPSPQVQPRMNQNPLPRGIPMQQPPPQMAQHMSTMSGYAHQPDVRVPSGGPIGMQPPAPLGSPMPMEQHIQSQQQQQTPLPTQLKVKVHCPSAGSSMTFVVPINITYQSLKDRIDVKLQRTTNLSLSSGHVKLKYLDDEDYVSISSDEDVQMAFETWRESQRGQPVSGIGEIELYIQ